ncbi:methyltransferase domain-containing protein [Phenylobacterium sp.]|uniref:methyltransferase domain-containing protein n=1 Tax=Phenylobacterium sp. TaxID=1871053 RepID=UPI00286A9BEA|nr:methyltransferase domain-containing protein [Phenylobacterium sp.]
MSQLTFDEAAARSLEAIYLSPDVVAQRARVIDLLAPRAGEQILDIGVGPGLLAHDIARLVGPAGRMVGLDNAPAMVAAAERRLADLPQASVRQGDAGGLDLPDEAFDAAVATQVYEYVPDIKQALVELHRVLRPGGRALILDTDWRSLVWHASDPARMDRVLACWDGHLADPHLPAKLGPLLRQAGFEVRRVEIVPMLSPRWQSVSYAGGMMRTIHDYARTNADRFGLDADEVVAWRRDQDELIARDEFFFSVNRYAFLATR